MIIHKLATYADPTLDRQFKELELALKPLSGSGPPAGTVAPRWLGDQYYDTAASTWYVSTGGDITDWQMLGSGGGGGGSNHNTTVDGGDGWASSGAYIDGGGWL